MTKPKVDVLRESLKLDFVIGEESKQFKVLEEFNLPRPVKKFLVPDITIPQDKIKVEVIEDKVIIEGELVNQVYYVGDDGIVYGETLAPQKFTEFVHMDGISPGNHAQVTVRSEDVNFEIIEKESKRRDEEEAGAAHHKIGTDVKQTAILEIYVKVTDTMKVEVVTDIIGPKIQPFKELVKVQNVVGEGSVQTSVISDVDFETPVKKIVTVDSAFTGINPRVIDDKVVIEGNLHKQIYYIDAVTGAVKEKSVDDSFTQFVDITGARPGMNVQVHPRVEFIDHVIDNNDRTTAKQTAVIDLFIKVTESVQMEVVVGADGIDVLTELFKVENVVGEDADQLTVTADVEFPHPVKKISNIVSNVNINEAKPIEDKVIIKGDLEKHVFYVDQKTSVLREMTIDGENFTHFIHIPGVTPGMNLNVTPRVEYVNIDMSNDDITGKQTAVLELFVKVTQTQALDVVTDVNVPDDDFCPPDATYVIYVVQPGDSLFKIAKRFGVTLNELIKANKDNIPDPDAIFPGQKVIVPCLPKPKG